MAYREPTIGRTLRRSELYPLPGMPMDVPAHCSSADCAVRWEHSVTGGVAAAILYPTRTATR